MSPLRMTIPGKYWDSYIYAGRLYLFLQDGSIQGVRWAELIQSWPIPADVRIPFLCAFLRSDYLYSSDVQQLLHDPEIRRVVQRKFRALADENLEIGRNALRKHAYGEQDNPCPFPHSDVEIYKANLYVGSASGLVSTVCNKKTRYAVGTRPERKWDGPSLGLSASYGSLAVASGDEGLYEFDIDGQSRTASPYGRPAQLSKSACRDCSYAYFSVFASSEGSGYLAAFTKNTNGEYDRTAERHFEGIEPAEEIFGSTGYAWGVQDKFCQAQRNSVNVVRYAPWADDRTERLQQLGVVRFAPWKGEIVSASTASFGVVVELENAIVVLPSAGRPITLRGEPVNWRVFPRSHNYENQLHVVYEDRIEILSFNHDYLVDQGKKVLGTRFSSPSDRRYSRRLIL